MAVAVAIGVFVHDWVPFERISGVPLPIPIILGLLAGAATILAVLVVDRLWDLYRGQAKALSGARMHRRLAALLSAVALIPAAVAFALTGIFLGSLTDEFFVDRIETSTNVARNLANAYAEGVSRQMGLTLLSAQQDLARARAAGLSPETVPIGYRKYLTGLAQIYELGELTHLSEDGRVVASVNLGTLPKQPLPPQSSMQRVSAGDGPQVSFGAVDPDTLSVYFAVISLTGEEGGYLVGYRRENPLIANELVAVRDFRDSNRALQRRVRELTSVANVGFLLLSVVLLLGAAWIGLLVSNAIVNPIRRLATAASLVSRGDLDSRVEVRRRDGELGDLGRAFNEMTEQLAEQRRDLIAAGEDAENRRRFIETMLGVIPAGVVNVDSGGRIGLLNASARRILGRESKELFGRQISDVLPGIEPILEDVRRSNRRRRESVEFIRNETVRTLVVDVSPETEHDPLKASYVISLEDITELITAQRTAAWADVARRIAHEIKNPLTPIQLSAERLQRRYRENLTGRDREIFEQCTSTIIRHVGDIGRMVTEFSSFARMPEPKMGENDLRELAREALFPFAVAHPDITFVSRMPKDPMLVHCDGRLIVQALTNLIKNAAEAISEASEITNGKVEVEVRREGNEAIAEVLDNGRGLPPGLKHRLTEPYMTTREKGTGLGLAIVRKAIEDQGGHFVIRDRNGGGAVASLHLPVLNSAEDQGETAPSDQRKRQGEAEAAHGH
jgi:two-component system nitrogen regulation sensor histidine kinase NtrY